MGLCGAASGGLIVALFFLKVYVEGFYDERLSSGLYLFVWKYVWKCGVISISNLNLKFKEKNRELYCNVKLKPIVFNKRLSQMIVSRLC